MNASTRGEPAPLRLVEIIELKWLLAAHGVRLHVERLQSDPEYARRTLDDAATSTQPTLRAVALRVRQSLGLGNAPA